MVQDTAGDAAASQAITPPADASSAAQPTARDALQGIVALLEKSVRLKDTRLLMGRLLRQTAVLRKRLSADALRGFITSNLPEASEARAYLLEQLGNEDDDAMAVDGSSTEDVVAVKDGTTTAPPTPSTLPEVELYAYLAVLIFLVDAKSYKEAKEVALRAVEHLAAFNRRTMDVIAARIYFYLSWAHESTGTLSQIRSKLLALHRTAVLHHDAIGQETLLTLLLRNYLAYNLYDLADKFRAQAHKADQWCSAQQFCRYLFYLGRIRAVQLEYSDAKDALQQAARKAPLVAHGFRVTVTKWLVLVRLLLGEVPERSELAQVGMRSALAPYLELTSAVRGGDLAAFKEVAERHASVFAADKTANLITRLHHNVIRTGLHRIATAYSRISLEDVAAKLLLPSVEDAQCIVAKAIRDGGIDAVVDYEQGVMRSREVADIYSTSEPQAAFHARIAFCLDLHNDAIKAMRFEPDEHKAQLETAKERKERLSQEAELAKAIQEDEDDI